MIKPVILKNPNIFHHCIFKQQRYKLLLTVLIGNIMGINCNCNYSNRNWLGFQIICISHWVGILCFLLWNIIHAQNLKHSAFCVHLFLYITVILMEGIHFYMITLNEYRAQLHPGTGKSLSSTSFSCKKKIKENFQTLSLSLAPFKALHRLAVPKGDKNSDRAERKSEICGYMQRNHNHFF